MNATQLKAALEQYSVCEGLDKWIETVLFEKMAQSVSYSVSVDTREVKWPYTHFKTAMLKRGFRVERTCLDMPCATPYYVIEIPPQSE